ncbi:Uncharacterised protein [Sebaldella termitidis]|jgi:regulatory protein YycH of two-component signal transduction system YycFG|uniref:Uncharacterized protein n=1 Tax=Sebaldella termitidis (strain ATCC 33386 / NCTC 11300) TaxID=526218 RepID=D1AJQ1_SEBTE|nr:hypothetical protein [Sebaldella termitidis]ACZ06958.1 hypothetical protein Sterm_0070 [Sebaldella termitidis ATCC 33386]SUI22246.1 Uncharacterised protein [Sebaldella termitidis]
MDIAKLTDFGIIGIVLSYFIWKDMKTFETFKELKELNIRIEKLEDDNKQ